MSGSDRRDIFSTHAPTPIQKLSFPLLEEKKVSLYVKRDDLIHPLVSGNKWRKLKYNVYHALEYDIGRLLTFGGAYSNHIHAFAAVCSLYSLDGVVVIRGEPYEKLNPTLQYVKDCGVHIQYISREQYRKRDSVQFLDALKKKWGDFFLIPEGGSNTLAVTGVKELVSEVETQLNGKPDVIVSAVGSGGTLAGIVEGLNKGQTAVGISVLKGAEDLENRVRRLAPGAIQKSWLINHDYCFGGYARFSDELIVFMKNFSADTAIPLEPIYTAKMFFGLLDMISNDRFDPGSIIVALHSGGLQAMQGLEERYPQTFLGYTSWT